MTRSNVHPLAIPIASKRRLSQHWYFGLMLPTLRHLVQQNCGWSTCSLAIFQNIYNASQIWVWQSTLHTSPHFPTCCRINWRGSITNGKANRGTFWPSAIVNSCMRSGNCYLMTISFIHSTLVWLYIVTMAFNNVCIHGSSPTLQIILRSKHFISHPTCVAAHCFIRVLLATIWDQGLCPCPCCLVLKSKLDQLGLVTDMNNWNDKACKYQADLVNKAQKAIFEQGTPIGGVAVERLLKDTLSIPTAVRPQSTSAYILIKQVFVYHRTCLSNDLVATSTCHACWSLISCMRLSSVFGRHSLHIWSKSCMQWKKPWKVKS